MIDRAAAPMVVCADAMLPIEMTGADRLLSLAVPPAWEALGPLLKRSIAAPRVAVFLALPEERPGRDERIGKSLTTQFVDALQEAIEVRHCFCHPLGHAGGILCMEEAASFIVDGRADICLVGGVDSYLEAETLEWLDQNEQLHSESTIWGFCPGEAAGFCVLASLDRTLALGVRAPLALVGACSAIEPNRIKTDSVCVGQGLSQAFTKTLAALPDDTLVDNIICDMNGEPYRANEYGFAVLRSPGKFAEGSESQTPADCWGDVGAASGPLFVVLAAYAAHKQYDAGPVTLVWASSEGGLRAGALLRRLDSTSLD